MRRSRGAARGWIRCAMIHLLVRRPAPEGLSAHSPGIGAEAPVPPDLVVLRRSRYCGATVLAMEFAETAAPRPLMTPPPGSGPAGVFSSTRAVAIRSKRSTVFALYIALGGALGAVARYVLGSWIHSWAGPGFPWGTFAINATGSLLIGLSLHCLNTTHAAPELRAFV